MEMVETLGKIGGVLLLGKRKFGFLDGSINEHVSPCTHDDWRTIHCILVSWLMNTTDDEEDRVLSMTRLIDDVPKVTGFVVRPTPRLKPRLTRAEMDALTCSHCGKSGHDISTCFDLHDVSKWYIEKFGHKPSTKSTASRDKAPSNVTVISDRGRGTVKANTTTTEPCVVGSSSSQQEPRYTASEWQARVAVFGTPPSSFNRMSGKWIIDFGIFNHVTGDLTWLSDIKDVVPSSVGLPYGQIIYASKEGLAQLTDNLTLRHVLYVPKLNCNLISVSQLSDDTNCEIITNSDLCVIQDRHTREVIGTGERRDGLDYFLKQAPLCAGNVVVSSSLEVWHCRL